MARKRGKQRRWEVPALWPSGRRSRRDSRRRWPLLVGLAALAIVALLLLAANAGGPGIALPGFLARGPRPTPLPTPFPAVPPETAERQLLATLDRWTSTQVVGIDCLMAACNQQLALSMTLLAPEVLEDMVGRELAGRPYTAEEFNRRLTELRTRLRLSDHIVFVLAVAPGNRLAPVRNEIMLGPLEQTMSLRGVMGGTSFRPAGADPQLNGGIGVSTNTVVQGYVFFPRVDEAGEPTIDFARDSSTSVTLGLNKSALRAARDSVIWNFDLISPARPAPAPPTATPDPNVTPAPPLVDRDLAFKVLEFLIEVADDDD